jgi:hypothetical protein
LYPLARVGGDLLTPGEPEAHVRAEQVPDQAGVDGEGGVMVGMGKC